MLAALGQVAHFAVGLGSSPLTVIGLVPIFAAGLAFMRYISVDPESHVTNIRYVSTFETLNRFCVKLLLFLGKTRVRFCGGGRRICGCGRSLPIVRNQQLDGTAIGGRGG